LGGDSPEQGDGRRGRPRVADREEGGCGGRRGGSFHAKKLHGCHVRSHPREADPGVIDAGKASSGSRNRSATKCSDIVPGCFSGGRAGAFSFRKS
jgi:hypothetical protein